MRKVRDTDIKLHLYKGDIFVEYGCVMELVKRHDKLIDELNERNN